MKLRKNDRVVIDMQDNGVAHVRLTRPDKMNALDSQMFAMLVEAGAALYEAKGLRAIVLSGDGPAFSAGLDLASMNDSGSLTDDDLTLRTHGNANLFQQVAMQWRKMPVPVIAALHGVCFGGGLQIASGADIRCVAPDTRMAIMEMKWGLVPDMGGYALWRSLVREDILRERIYTNREFSGQEAVDLGFATCVSDDPLAQAMTLAGEIAQRSPHAVRAAKRLANAMADHDTDRILIEESREQHALIRSANQTEAVMAGIEKRPPSFDDV